MATLVNDCARCGCKKSTHDCYSSIPVRTDFNWKVYCEIFAVCRACHKSSIVLVSQRTIEGPTALLKQINKITESPLSLNDFLNIERVISIVDRNLAVPPEHLPTTIYEVVLEGNRCIAAQCWNAAAAMYRLAMDLTTKPMMPESGEPSHAIRRSLGLRLKWLFDNQLLPADMRPLAECIQQDGNDGAHDGTLSKVEADDLHDFLFELLRRVYTDPIRIRLAEERRAERRKTAAN